MMTTNKRSLGLYLHIPFCIRKCNYCDFRSLGAAETSTALGGIKLSGTELQEAYVRRLCREIESYGQEEVFTQQRRDGQEADNRQEGDINQYYVDSIFFGGGTPSLLAPQLIHQLLETIFRVFSMGKDVEITLEANPGTVDPAKLKSWRNMGINRLSLGAQSMDDRLLAFLGRIHRRKDIFDSYSMARRAGFDNINIDLMFGIPTQTMEIWQATAKELFSFDPEHCSFYSLQIEEGTPFYQWFCQKRLVPVPEELDRAMYHWFLERLKEQGYIHYEISNGAKKGKECRHNLKYWSMEDYLGFGLAAHSYIKGLRFYNTSDMDAYLQGSSVEEIHRNDRYDSISDYLFTELRQISGICLADFEKRFGQSLASLYPCQLRRFLDDGLLWQKEGRLGFTEKGLDFTNTVLRELMTGGGTQQ